MPRRRAERRGLRLWPVGPVLVLSFLAAVLVAAGAFLAGWGLLGVEGLRPERRLASSTLFDLVKLSFGVVAGAGALVALVVAYRRQRIDEDGALREATRLHTERFTTAVSQLGDEAAAVRLGGVHALAGLADDAPTRELRQTCIDVLCAYLRLPYTAEADIPEDDAAARHGYRALREVRLTVIRLIRDHLRLPAEDPRSWQGHHFDFTGVRFDGGDFSEAVFSGGTVDFSSSEFSSETVSFRSAEFSGALVDFRDTAFNGGVVTFSDAVFTAGTADFTFAHFPHGLVFFERAWFAGAVVRFDNAIFDGSFVSFNDSVFAGGAVEFSESLFAGGSVEFSEAVLSEGTVGFRGSEFSGGTLDFGRAGGDAPTGLPTSGPYVGIRLPEEWSSPGS
ncbi:hypothetical protein GCM10009801_51120 [Streptomyces albiaxialis]|uniref:Pentapeptide repeat-containing protein n=1 Tax=Streptomyces albiaxialis TaxID=329523 RepID=A0ABN2WAQ2_9ACTN